jgi:Tfp pilus assembly protein PilF
MNFAADLETMVQLAAQDLQKNDLPAAKAKVLSVLDADRDHAGAWSVLGLVLQGEGRSEDALRVFNSLALKHPTRADHWENLGGILRELRRLDEALAAFERAVALAAPGPRTLYNIGVIQAERLDFVAAEAVLRRAVELASTDAWIRAAFAQCCYELGRFPDAVQALENWERFDQLTSRNMTEIAHLLVMMGERRRAQAAIDWLLLHPPDDARAALTLANVYERMNRLEEARACLGRARAGPDLKPADADLALTEAVLAQREGNDERARQLLIAALEQPLDFVRRHSLLYPMAQSLDTLGRYEEAFAALVEAHRSQIAYLQAALGKSPTDASPILALTQGGVAPEDRATWSDADAPSAAESPIFVVGFPRSGTTLLEQTLDSHPALIAMDEQPFLQRAIDEVRSLSIAYPVELGRLTPQQLQSIRARYWKRVDEKVQLTQGQRLVDKNPFNVLRLPLIRRLFPNARTVLIVRHPGDVLVSCYAQHFRAPDLALLCRDLETLAEGYRRTFDFWYQELPLIGAATYELRYENFVANLAGEARKLTDFLDLPWNDALLSPAHHARTKEFISTPSYTQVIEPVSSKPVGRWRHYEKHVRAVLPRLAPYLERWGYEAASSASSSG